MNKLLSALKEEENYTLTENGAAAYKSTLNKVYDLFAFGGSYRQRIDEDCIKLFEDAFYEDKELALKCLFYLGDVRGGQGERRFFRVCFKWLIKNHRNAAEKLLVFIPFYKRWDDLIYCCLDTPLENRMVSIIKVQLAEDLNSNSTLSLLGKWMPSENASSSETIHAANTLRIKLGFTHKEYRKMLSSLRSRIKVVERMMSSNEWNKIKFDEVPSRAGLIYRNAFLFHDSERYKNFILNKETKVKASVLYPYEIVEKARHGCPEEKDIIQKYWENLPDYFDGKQSNILCVVDTSGSMCIRYNGTSVAPIDVAISLGIYCAERCGGPFKNHYISFSNKPQLVGINPNKIYEQVQIIYRNCLNENTNLAGVFDLLLDKIIKNKVPESDIPENIVIISDMQIDRMSYWKNEKEVNLEMDKIRKMWETHNIPMPKLIYWNVNARNNTILDKNENVSYVSGFSPTIFETILTGKTGYELCLQKLLSDRYNSIQYNED